MKNFIILLSVAVLSLLAVGCVRPVIIAPTNEERSFEPTNPSDIKVSTNETLEKKSIEVGYVFAQEKSLKNATKLAREEAAKMGGNAIIGARASTQVILSGFVLFIPIYETVYHLRGTVVKY